MAKRSVVRDRIVAILDSLKLDALVYPTMQRRPVLIGDPQAGGTCQLSAHSGLPALSAPSGFTADGLPVGFEMIGRPFDDVRLVSIAHAFEKLAPRRRPPPTTPPLINGRAPGARTLSVVAAVGRARTVARFTFDPATGALAYQVTVTGLAADSAFGVFLRRPLAASGGAGPVIQRLVPPQFTQGAGVVTLTGVDRAALESSGGGLELYALSGAGSARGRVSLRQ
jgi:hypothetical protein